MDDDINEFRRMVAYFWLEKGDPTRLIGFTDEVCAKQWPEFYLIWKQHQALESVLNTLCRDYRDNS